jgi:hypothetical protein
MALSDPLNIINKIKPHDHYVLFYNTIESKRSFIYPYLTDGLLKDRAIVYICYEETPENFEKGLLFYIDTPIDELSNLLLIKRHDEWYFDF